MKLFPLPRECAKYLDLWRASCITHRTQPNAASQFGLCILICYSLSNFNMNDKYNTYLYDEEEVVADDTQFYDNPDEKPVGNSILKEDEYLAEVGDINCYCLPTRVYGVKDFFYRTYGWIVLNKEQILGAFTMSLTQIPEAVSGALIAGVDPALALRATCLMNLITSMIGGRPGMISGTTPFVGIALADLVLKEGVEYVYYAIMFAGFLQVAFGVLGLGALMRFVPHSVIQGFCNAISVYTVLAQFRFCKISPEEGGNVRRLVEFGHSWNHIADYGSAWIDGSALLIFGVHALVAFLICIGLPKITRAVPSSFIALLFCLIMNQFFEMLPSKYASPTVSDFTTIKLSTMLPVWSDKNISMPSLNVDTFFKVYLHGLAVFGTGLSESILASQIVDELTEVKSNKGRVAIGQGVANIIVAIFGGMGGSGSMAQTIVANHSDGITGLCTFLTSIFQLIFLYAAYDFVNIIPLGAISGIMIWGAFKLFDFESILQAFSTIIPLSVRSKIHLDCKTPRVDALIMLAVMGITLCLDLSIGLLSGVLIATFAFVWDSSTRVLVERELSGEETTNVTYSVSGPLFFATAGGFCDIFPIEEIQFDPEEVIIILENAEIYDYSGMVALKKVYDRFTDAGKFVAISSISSTSRRLMEKTAYMWEGVNFLEVDEV